VEDEEMNAAPKINKKSYHDPWSNISNRDQILEELRKQGLSQYLE